MNLLIFFSASITLTLCLLSFSKKQYSKSNIWLALWMLVVTAEILIYYVDYNDLYQQFPFAVGLKSIFPFIHAPLLYLYIRSLTGWRITPWKVLFHFTPLMAFLLNLSPLFLVTYERKMEIIRQTKEAFTGSALVYFLPIVVFLYVGTYLMVAYQTLSTAKASAIRDIAWIKKLTLTYLIFWILITGLGFLSINFYPHFARIIASISLFTFTTFLIILGIDGLSNTSLFTNIATSVKENFSVIRGLKR